MPSKDNDFIYCSYSSAHDNNYLKSCFIFLFFPDCSLPSLLLYFFAFHFSWFHFSYLISATPAFSTLSVSWWLALFSLTPHFLFWAYFEVLLTFRAFPKTQVQKCMNQEKSNTLVNVIHEQKSWSWNRNLSISSSK